MFKKYLKVNILIFLLISSTALHGQKVSNSGTTAANFLEIPVGASAVGLGGAFVSIANDATALFWNSAGIANLSRNELVLNHIDWIGGTKYDFAGIVINLQNYGNLGISFTSLSMDDMIVTTIEKQDGTGELFTAQDISMGLTYSRALTDRFSIGFNVKYIKQSIWHMSASAFAIDIGTLFRTDLLGGLVIGASLSNFGTPMTLEGRDARYFIRVDDTKLGSNESIPTNIEMDTWELPLMFRIGISTYIFQSPTYSILIATDAVHPNNNYPSINVGSQFSFMDYFFLRIGYNELFLQDAEGGVSLG
ncbi:MAG: PorV/PorQ family protein, partial [Melioribacteraceae bacterium]|nr:PorV/PorQ family protein [Melioribacteraceae bacterium]